MDDESGDDDRDELTSECGGEFILPTYTRKCATKYSKHDYIGARNSPTDQARSQDFAKGGGVTSMGPS